MQKLMLSLLYQVQHPGRNFRDEGKGPVLGLRHPHLGKKKARPGQEKTNKKKMDLLRQAGTRHDDVEWH